MKGLLTGLATTGKSTVAELCADEFEVIELGRIMERIAKTRGLMRAGDELQDLSFPVRTELQNSAMLETAFDCGNMLVLAHLVVQGPEGFVPGLQRSTLEMGGFDSIICLTASASKIAERRRNRGYANVEIDGIDFEKQLQIISATMWAQHLGLPLIFLDTTIDHPELTAVKVKNAVNTMIMGKRSASNDE